ncbi:hypothetical protein TB2_034844 [Malus domestica]
MKPTMFVLNIYSTMRTYYNRQPVIVAVAAEPKCIVKWELKLVVTNRNSKHGFDLYIRDHLQATLFLYDHWLGSSFMVTTKSLHPPLLLTSKTNQTATLSFKMQTNRAYLGEELIEEISIRIIQVQLNVMA